MVGRLRLLLLLLFSFFFFLFFFFTSGTGVATGFGGTTAHTLTHTQYNTIKHEAEGLLLITIFYHKFTFNYHQKPNVVYELFCNFRFLIKDVTSRWSDVSLYNPGHLPIYPPPLPPNTEFGGGGGGVVDMV